MQPTSSQVSPDLLRFHEALQRGQLMLPKCQTCGDLFYPPKAQCPRCGGSALEWARCSGKGRVYSYMVNYRPAGALPGEAWEVMAVVELQEGPRILAPVVGLKDASAVQVDMAVEAALERTEGQEATLRFRPV